MATTNWYDTLPDSVWGGNETAETPTVTPIGTSSANTTGATTSKDYYNQGMEELSKQASGTSSIFSSLENRANQNWGGAALASMGAAKQEAAQAGYSPEAIGSVAQTKAKALEGERSTLMGDIASQKQSLSNTASQQLVSSALSGQSQELAERAQGFSEKSTMENQRLAERAQALSENTAAASQKQTDWERMLSTYDANTPEGLSALQAAYTKLFGGDAPDLNAIKQQQEYVKTKQQQELTTGAIGVSSAEQTLKDQQSASIAGMVNSGYTLDRINSELGTSLTDEEYANLKKNTANYFTQKGIDAAEAALYGYTDESGNHVQGSAEIAAEQLDLQAKTLEDQEKELWGYTDADGTVHKGKYDLLTEEDQRAADQLYGYDVKDAEGNVIGSVKGTLELQNDSATIEAQGLELEEAQVKGYIDSSGNYIKGSVQLAAEKQGLEVSSLYGYTYNSDTGEIVTDAAEIAKLGSKAVKVDGSLALAQKEYGLTESSFEMQYAEMFGVDYETGEAVIGSDGKAITGKIQLLSEEGQRAADQLYGYTETLSDGTTVKHSGTLQIAEDELAIKQQGLTMEEAQYYGYEKTNEDGTTEHVAGTLEIESQKLDLLQTEYDDQQSNTAGVAVSSYFGLMMNTTGYDYSTDKQAKALLQQYWESIPGNEGTEYDEAWAQRQYEASTVSESDAAIKALESSDWYKELQKTDTTQAAQVMQVAKVSALLSVTQGVTPIYGDDGTVIGIQDSEGNDIYTVATEETAAETTTKTADAWDDFMGTIPTGINVTEATWEAAGKPTSYDTYKKTASSVSAIDNLEVESSSELLSANNSKVVFDAYKKDPEAVKSSDYYFEIPTTDYLSSNITHNTSKTGIHTTKVSDALKETINGNVGKLVEIESGSTTYAGLLMGYITTPNTVQIKIKKSDGTVVNVPIGVTYGSTTTA